MQAVHLKQPCTVIDLNLTMQLAYTAQPVLLDAHLNHKGEKGSRINHQTLPQHCIYKLADGTCFVFKQRGELFQSLSKAHLSNDDREEVFYA